MDDGRIIELFFERSEQAIEELSKKYGNVCLRTADNILNDIRDSEECVNDAYLGVWNSVPPQKPDPLLTYVCRIVRNLAIKKYHRNSAAKRNSAYDIALDEIAECFSAPGSVEDEADANETSEIINDFLKTLDKKDRVMFVRRYWYSETTEEIAAASGTGKHYVSVKLSRIRKALKKYLKSKGVFI